MYLIYFSQDNVIQASTELVFNHRIWVYVATPKCIQADWLSAPMERRVITIRGGKMCFLDVSQRSWTGNVRKH